MYDAAVQVRAQLGPGNNAKPFTKLHHLCNYEHIMVNLEHKGLIYLCHNRFWTKNKTPSSDEYRAFGISQISWQCYEIWYAPQEI